MHVPAPGPATPVSPPAPLVRERVASPPEPVGGRILTPTFKVLLVLLALGTAAGAVRFFGGLGAATAMNDGFPWGIWIALDVAAGTALACGGYALALLVYILNRGRFHPLVRPAILTSALGYSVAGIAIVFDVGRYWNLWKLPLYIPRWNLSSALLEVALCVMAYIAVAWIELAPAFLEKWRAGDAPRLRRFAEAVLPALEKALPWILALGLLLPTLHQSTLGSLLLIAVTKLHPLWHTPLLPLLFLVSCLGMGFAVMVLETTWSSVAFGRPRHGKLLAALSTVAGWVTLAWLVVRFGDLFVQGRLDLAFEANRFAAFLWLETALLAAGAVLLLGLSTQNHPRRQVGAASLLLAGGVLYRLDVYLVAFQPGPGWVYFPSVGEILITVGLVATETMAYLYIVKRFPILSGAPRAARA